MPEYNWDGELQFTHEDEKGISDLLVGRKVMEASGETLVLDDGTRLEVYGNEGGCSCSAGDYYLTELNNVDNIIMGVSIEDRYKTSEEREAEDYANGDQVYTIFVYAENEKIKLAEFEGSDGSGYYGTGFKINVKKSIFG